MRDTVYIDIFCFFLSLKGGERESERMRERKELGAKYISLTLMDYVL
jgi:hypothetical protein